MTAMTEIARKFFDACETGKGWEGCKAYCTPDATFAAQAEPLADIKTLQNYTEWMKGLLTFVPDGRYEVKSFATDEAGKSVSGLRRLLRHAHRPGRPLPADGQEDGDGLRLRDVLRRRQGQAHAEDLARRSGDERSRLGLSALTRTPGWRGAAASMIDKQYLLDGAVASGLLEAPGPASVRVWHLTSR